MQTSQRYLLYKPMYSRFCPKFRCHAWQRGLVVVEFVWHPSTARPRKPPVIHKDLADISYTNQVIADFVPNFVAMATRVGIFKISLTSFDSLTPKTPLDEKISEISLTQAEL